MNRRKFLRNMSLAAAGQLMLGGLPVNLLAGNGYLKNLSKSLTTDRVLVLIQLHGGNDALNTVVPTNQYDHYYQIRPNIALPNYGSRSIINLDSTIALDNQVAVHPDMMFFKQMYDNGAAAVVQNVGFENMNGSHFRGNDIMFMGGGSDDYWNSGWMGRFLDFNYPGYPESYPSSEMPDPLALEIGNFPTLAFHRESGIPANIFVDSPQAFYDLINSVGVEPPIFFPDSYAGEELKYLMQFEGKVNEYAGRLKDVFVAGRNDSSVTYPEIYPLIAPQGSINNPLTGQLRLVARLLSGGCKTRIFVVRMGGFDTHANQVLKDTTIENASTMGPHAALMYHLTSATKAFFDDLRAQGLADKVLAMTFTEFGRRAYSNASYGTDHGTATPVLLFGDGLKGGVYGTNPKLGELDGGNLKYTTDYRQIYTSIVQDWLGASDEAMVTTRFDTWIDKKLDLIEKPAQGVSKGAPAGATTQLQSCYPNPAGINSMVRIPYFLDYAQNVQLTLHDTMGRTVRTLVSEHQLYGNQEVVFSTAGLKQGAYIYKLQTGNYNSAKTLIVR